MTEPAGPRPPEIDAPGLRGLAAKLALDLARPRVRCLSPALARRDRAPALGNLEAGAVASLTSIRTSVVSGGLACVAGRVVVALAIQALIRYDARGHVLAPA